MASTTDPHGLRRWAVRASAGIVVLFAFGLEAFAAHNALNASFTMAGSAHLAAAGTFAVGLATLLPPGAVSPRGFGRFTLFAIALCIPALGLVGLAVGLTWALYARTAKSADPFVVEPPLALPVEPHEITRNALPSSVGDLALTLHCARNPDARVVAVMACRGLEPKRAVSLLRIALRDPVDDVRLLAHVLISNMDKAIGERIQRRLKRIEQISPRDGARLHRALAHDYWDLAYLGLVSADVEAHMLDRASQHLEQALERELDPSSELLLGRVRLRQRRPTEAEAALERARTLGLPPVAVAPYQAEAAFQRRDFEGVRDRLLELPASSRRREPIAEIIRFWLDDTTRGSM